MTHVYLHKRKEKDDTTQGDNNNGGDGQLTGLENGINSLVAAASSFFNPAPAVGASISKDHQNHHLEIRQADDNSGNKGPSTVFTTAPWTGSGTDFSYSTVLPDATSAAPKDPVPAQTTKSQDPTSTTLRKTTQRTTASSSLSSSASDTVTAAAAAATTTTAAISSILSISSTTDTSAAAVTSAASTIDTSSSNNGLSTGAKAGIAITVILLLIAIAAGAFMLWRMKKNRDEEAHDLASSSEKNPFSDTAATNSRPPPPIMSSMMKPSTPTNPFGSGAVTVPPATSSLESDAITSAPGNNPAMAMGASLASIGAVVGVAAANARRASIPAPLNLVPRTQTPPLISRTQTPPLMPPPAIAPSPSGSNFSEASTFTTGAMAALGDAGINTPGGPRMHRVQMDFNPTMEDELRITAGDIIRVDREFDDGWVCFIDFPLIF